MRKFPSALPLLGALLSANLAAQSGPVIHSFDGLAAYQGFGGALSGCADLDSDGVRDLLVGCQAYASGPGLVRAFSGASGSLIHEWSGFQSGHAVADAGDVDGDGISDVMIGDQWAGPVFGSEGSAWIYSGATGDLIYRFDGGGTDRYLGTSLAGLGDLNQDGYGDFLIGAWGEYGQANFSGVAYVYSGIDGSVMARIEGQTDHGYFGSSGDAVDDVDGDGVTDFVIGAYGADSLGFNTGAVYLYSGATMNLLRSWDGPEYNSRFGGSVRSAGDVDGDGRGDVIIGAMFSGGNGEAFVYSGATGNLIYRWRGLNPDEVFGADVDGAGDTNGDGIDDLIVASDHFYVTGGYTGFVYVYSGADGKLLQYFTAGSATARLGNAVAGLGDVDGDGLSDLAAGAIDELTPGGTKSGRVFLFSGARTGLLFEVARLQSGGAAILRLSGCNPTSNALFAYSITGPGPTSTPLGMVSLSPPIETFAPVPCDPNGAAEFTFSPLPPTAFGLTLYTQAAELYSAGGGALSHPLVVEVR
jgi:FG-GAP repeat protein